MRWKSIVEADETQTTRRARVAWLTRSASSPAADIAAARRRIDVHPLDLRPVVAAPDNRPIAERQPVHPGDLEGDLGLPQRSEIEQVIAIRRI